MKQKFYPVICAIVIALNFLTTSISAQTALVNGNYPGSSENLLGTRYRKIRIENDEQNSAIYAGIPDLGNNRNNSKNERDFNYGRTGTFTFRITYSVSNNTFTTVTTVGSNSTTTTFSNVSNKLSADGKNISAANINLLTLKVKSYNNNTITVSNLTIEGMPVPGSYGRSNSQGTSNWHLTTSLLNGGFVVAGTVTMSGSMHEGSESQLIELGFAHSATAPGPLPVIWGGFAGKRVNNSTVGLQWRTMQEQNASHYNIQRSEDGVHFRTIGMAMAQGTTASVTDYNFDDKQATANMYYYRLEQVDLDGTSNFSSIIKQGNGGKKTLVGGLGSNKILVQFFSNDNRNIRIVNNSGIVVKQMNSTTQTQTLDVNNMPTGVYALQIINSDGTSEVHRFVK